MLPQQTLFAREIGDTQSPYWTAATLDGLKLLLEPGESLLRVCYCRVSKLGPNAWTLENPTTVVVTDRRTAFLTTQFDKGGGWVGFGVAGLAVAVTANAVSKRRAATSAAPARWRSGRSGMSGSQGSLCAARRHLSASWIPTPGSQTTLGGASQGRPTSS